MMPMADARRVDPTWTVAELEPSRYRVSTAPSEHSALTRVAQAADAWSALGHRDVPATCSALWQRIESCLERTAGFCVVSGLPYDGTVELARRVTFLVGHALGTPVFQDAQGGRMVDIRSTEADLTEATTYKPRSDGTHVRPYETRVSFRLHADPCDVAGLFCVRAAARGGSSTLVNARTVHDRLAETQPALLRVLHEPFYYVKPRRAGEAPTFHAVPVFSWRDGWFKAHIVPDLIYIAQLTPETPRLSDVQHAALDALIRVASSPEFQLTLDLRPGELLLLNNHVVWHGREAYEDAKGAARHLLRIWLATPGSRPLDPIHEGWFGDPRAGALRGGYLRERLHELARG